MTESQKFKIRCPNCQHVQSVEIFETIDVSLYEGYKEKAKNLEFFKTCCENCKKDITLAYNCLYNDIDKRIMIWLLPNPTEEEVKSINAARQREIDGRPVGSLYIERIVTTPDELKEKLLIFEAGYDDRIIELLKIIFLAQLDKITGSAKIKDEPVDAIYFDSAGEEDKGSFAVFFKNREPLVEPLDYKLYLKLFDDFIEFVGHHTKAGFQFIDYEWAIEIIKKKAKEVSPSV